MELFVPGVMCLSTEGGQLTGHKSHEHNHGLAAEMHRKLQVNAFNRCRLPLTF